MTGIESSSSEAAPSVTPQSKSSHQSQSKHVSGKSGKSKKRKRSNNKVPKPGEEGYLTPTQRRNSRKRRAKQRKKGQGGGGGGGGDGDGDDATPRDPSLQYISNPREAPVVRTARAFFHSLNKRDFVVHVGKSRGWRTVAKLAVRPDSSGHAAIGLFAPKSHTLIAVPECEAHHSSINTTVSVLQQLCRQVGVVPFDDTTGEGQLRHVAINVERSTGLVQITLVWNSEPNLESGSERGEDSLENLCRAIIEAGTSESNKGTRRRRRGRNKSGVQAMAASITLKLPLHSLWIHYNNSWKHSNAIFALDGGETLWEHRYGPKIVTETLDLRHVMQQKSVPLQFAPNVFRQANLDAFANIVAAIRTHLGRICLQHGGNPKLACTELYGGVGTIGLNVCDMVASLVSSDENPFNVNCFGYAATKLPTELRESVTYQSKSASDMVENRALEKAQVVIVDPPRKGLDADVLHALCVTEKPQVLVYVSCGFDAFQRDCRALLASKWQLDHAEGYVLFPGSDAIETLAFFVSKISEYSLQH